MIVHIIAAFLVLYANATCKLQDDAANILENKDIDYKDDDPIIMKVPVVVDPTSTDCYIHECQLNTNNGASLGSDYIKYFQVAGQHYIYYAQNYRPGYEEDFKIRCYPRVKGASSNGVSFYTPFVKYKQPSECGDALSGISVLDQTVNFEPDSMTKSSSAQSITWDPASCGDSVCQVLQTSDNSEMPNSYIDKYDTYSNIMVNGNVPTGYGPMEVLVECSSGRGANTYTFKSSPFKVTQLESCKSTNIITDIWKHDVSGFTVDIQTTGTEKSYDMSQFFTTPTSGCDTFVTCSVLDKDETAIDISKAPYKDYMSFDDPPTKITFKQDYAGGYDLDLLFKCSAGTQSQGYQDAQVNKKFPLSVKQNAKCFESLSAKDNMKFLEIDYDLQKPLIDANTVKDTSDGEFTLGGGIGIDWKSSCPITVANDCSLSNIDKILKDQVVIKDGILKFVANNKDGYTGKFKVTCKDEQANEVSTNIFTVTQLSPCATTKYLSEGFAFSNVTIDYKGTADESKLVYTGIKSDRGCKIQQCKLQAWFNGDARHMYSADNVGISVTDGVVKFNIKKNDEVNGYEDEIVVKCYGEGSSDIVTDSRIVTFSQKAQCKDKLKKVWVNTQSFDYKLDGKAKLSTFPIKSLDPTNCPIQSCELNGAKNDYILEVTTSYIEVSQSIQSASGYRTFNSFKCKGKDGLDELTSDNVEIKQQSKCAVDLKTTPVAKKVIPYQDTPNRGWIDHGITVKDSVNCKVESCTVTKKGGSEATNLSIAADNKNTDLVAKMNVVEGYAGTYTVTCKSTNDLQTISNDIEVEQLHKCKGSKESAINIKTEPKSQTSIDWNEGDGEIKVEHGVEGIDGCPFTCVFYNPTTTQDFTPQNVKFDSDYNALVDTKTTWEGFESKFKFKCSNDQSEQVVTNTVTVKTKSKCFQMLSLKKDIQTHVFDYLGTATQLKDLNILPATSQDQVNCKIKECKLISTNQRVQLKKKDDGSYTIIAEQNYNQKGGYEEDVQVQCENDDTSDTTNTFKVQQNANPCLTSMGVVSTVLTPWNKDYNIDEPKFTGTLKWDEQFPDSSGKCPNQVCKLYGSNCKDAVDNRVTINSKADGYTLSMEVNEPEGYKADVCVECDNGDQKQTKTFTVNQQPRCIDRMKYKYGTTQKEYIMRFKDQTTMETAIPDLFLSSFRNDNTDNLCPVTKCEIKALGCKNDWKETNLFKVEQDGANFKLAAGTNQVYGYIRNICISCTNGGKGINDSVYYPRQTINQDNIRIQLPSKCNYAMTQNSAIPKIIVKDHDDEKVADPVLSKGYEEYFLNADKLNCPVESCMLYDKDCKNLHNQKNIKMEATYPWKITIGDNVENGYTDEACIVCKNDWQIIKYDKIKIQQNGRCLQKLQKKMFSVPNLPLSYRETNSQKTTDKIRFNSSYKSTQDKNGCTSKTHPTNYLGQQSLTTVEDCTNACWKMPSCVAFNFQRGEFCHFYSADYECDENPSQDKYYMDFGDTMISTGWNDFFTNQDSQKYAHKCPVTSCELLDKDCKTKWTLPAVLQMEDTYPFKIYANQKVIEGLKKDACVKCHNQHQFATSMFKYSQLSKCVNQFSLLPYAMGKDETSDQSSLGDQKQNKYEYVFDYNSETKEQYVQKSKDSDATMTDNTQTDETQTDETNTDETNTDETNSDETNTDETNTDETNTDETNSDETNTDQTNTDETDNSEAPKRRLATATVGAIFPLFFQNDDTVNCPHTECKLMGPGCAFEYSSTKFVEMEKQAPWRITAKTDVSEGYNTTVCVMCSNMYQDIVQDNIIIAQRVSVRWDIVGPIIFAVCALIVCIIGTVVGKIQADKNAALEATSESEIPSKVQGNDKVKVVDEKMEFDNVENFEDDIQKKVDDDSDDGAPESVRSGVFAVDTDRPAVNA